METYFPLSIFNLDRKKMPCYSNTKTHFYRKNIFGDVIAIIKQNGEEAGKYYYISFGALINAENLTDIAKINPFRYRSYYYDRDLGLYYLKSRYYDQVVGRFISLDDIEYIDPDHVNGLNLYSYCGNNPIMYVDPTGHAWWDWLIGGLALLAGIVLCFIPGGQPIGAALLIGGISLTASNIMSAVGVEGKVANIISLSLDIVAGIALSFVPGLQGLGASFIGSGTLGIAGGYISEATGGTFSFGASIGSIVGGIIGGKIFNSIYYSKIAKKGILIGKAGQFERAAAARNLAYYNGLPGYKGIEKVLGTSLTSKLGWAHNYTYISNVMKYGGRIYNLGGAATGSYGKELALIAKRAYQLFFNLF